MHRQILVGVVVIAATVSVGWGAKALHVMENNEIKVEINDYEYPYDQIEYLYGASTWIENLYHLKLAFWDGGEIWEYNTTTLPNGFSRLVEVQDWSFTGTDPNRVAHVRLGDHATTPTFTIDLTIRMQGNGVKAIKSDFVIDMTAAKTTRSSPKLYLYGDPKVSGSDWTNRSGYRGWRNVFYVFDTQTTPNLYFGLYSPQADTGPHYRCSFQGTAYTGSYGTELIRNYMVTGQNLPNQVNNTAGNQVGAWAWDLGTGTANRAFTVYMGLGTSIDDLADEVHAPIFLDGFESGNTSRWSATTP